MKPMTADALKRRAMALGAKLEIDGRAFNVGRSQIAALVKPQPKPEPKEEPDEPPEPEDTSLKAFESVANVTLAMCQVQSEIIDHLREQAAKVAPAKLVPKSFKIHRNANGDMTDVEIIWKKE